MYRHGIYVSEQETSMIAPLNGTAGLQVVIGTAPGAPAGGPGCGHQ